MAGGQIDGHHDLSQTSSEAAQWGVILRSLPRKGNELVKLFRNELLFDHLLNIKINTIPSRKSLYEAQIAIEREALNRQ